MAIKSDKLKKISFFLSDFKNIDIVCDLNGIPNDPSSELNKKHTWGVNYYGRKKFAEIADELLDFIKDKKIIPSISDNPATA